MELLLSPSGDRYLGRHLMHAEEHWNPVASIIGWESDEDMNTGDQDLVTTVLLAHSAEALRPISTIHLSTNSPIRCSKVVGLNFRETVSTTIRSLIPCPTQASWFRTSAGITWDHVWKATEDTQRGPDRTFVEVSGTQETFQGTRDALSLHFLPHWNKGFLWGDCGGWRCLQCRHMFCHSVGFLPLPLGEQTAPAGGHWIEAEEINHLVCLTF